MTAGLQSQGVNACFTPSSQTFFASFDVGAVIGRGAFSEVRLVRPKLGAGGKNGHGAQQQQQQRVMLEGGGPNKCMAAKVIPKSQHEGRPRRLRRLRDELRVLCGVSHSFIDSFVRSFAIK